MTSQIFQIKPNQKSISAVGVDQFTVLQWLSVILLVAAVVLFPEKPAWGSEMDIEVRPNGIQGHAHQIELSEVLEVLADEGGYIIYLDEELVKTLVTFNIPDAIPVEKAIQKIVHPHSQH